MKKPKRLIALQETQKITIELDDGELHIWVKEPTFLDVQKAIQVLMKDEAVDLPRYWEYAFENWVEKTEPEIDLSQATMEVGAAVAEHLPSPQELFDVLGFSKARPPMSETI